MLEALVHKTETIREHLAAIGQVIETRIAERGISRSGAKQLAAAVNAETDQARLTRARAEMDDDDRDRHAKVGIGRR